MKKVILSALFFIVCVCSFAQKSYLHVFSEYSTGFSVSYGTTSIHLIGDKPSDMEDKYSSANINEILEKLTGKGYTLDFVTNLSLTEKALIGNDVIVGSIVYILSKPSEEASAVRSVTIDNDEEVTEVARYNLQGLPVKRSDKGVQIIVYSNYTTKIVNIQ